MFCPKCGHLINEGELFCQNCGEQVTGFQQSDDNVIQQSYDTVAQQTAFADENAYTTDYINTPDAMANSPFCETAPAASVEKVVKAGRMKNARITVSIMLLVCAFFIPMLSFAGIVNLSAWNVVDLLYISDMVIPVADMSVSEMFSQSMEVGGLSNYGFVIIAFLVVFYAFCLSSVGVLIGALCKKRAIIKIFSIIGILFGIIIFVGLFFVHGVIKEQIADMVFRADGYVLVPHLEYQIKDFIAEASSPFNVLSLGYWGAVLLYLTSFVLALIKK